MENKDNGGTQLNMEGESIGKRADHSVEQSGSTVLSS